MMFPKPQKRIVRVGSTLEIYMKDYEAYVGKVIVHLNKSTNNADGLGLVYMMSIETGAHEEINPDWMDEFQECVKLGVMLSRRDIVIEELMPERI